MTNNTKSILTIPNILVNKANALGGSLVCGIPSVQNFTGLMDYLGKKINNCNIFTGIGFVCHGFKLHYNNGFVIPKKPLVLKDKIGSSVVPASLTPIANIDMHVSLIFGLNKAFKDEDEKENFCNLIKYELLKTKLAGGTILNSDMLGVNKGKIFSVRVQNLGVEEEKEKNWKTVIRNIPTGFALISREDLLSSLNNEDVFAKWIESSKISYRFCEKEKDWNIFSNKKGWVVPISVGYMGIAPIYDQIKNVPLKTTRDNVTPVCFVESIYSLGEYKSINKIKDYSEVLWNNCYLKEKNLYCVKTLSNLII